MGMLLADIVRDYSLTVMLRGSETGTHQISELFETLREKAYEDARREGFEEVLMEEFLDMRYVGQSYELTVPFTEDFREGFEREHEHVYGYRHGREVEIVNIRLRAVIPTPKPELRTFEKKSSEDPSQALLGVKKTAFGGEFVDTKVYKREKLRWGNVIEGSAIVVEYSSTTLIPPGSYAEVDRFGNLIITV